MHSGRKGEGIGQVGEFGNGQVDATVILSVAERSYERSRPSRMRNADFFTNGPVSLHLEYQPAGPLEEILGAPQIKIHRMLPYGPIRSNASSWLIYCAYCMGQVRSDSGAPELAALLLT